MNIKYRGFDVEAQREKGMNKPIQYSIHRQSDRFQVMAGKSYGDDTVVEFMHYLTDVVDNFILDPQAYYRDVPPEKIIDVEEEEDEQVV